MVIISIYFAERFFQYIKTNALEEKEEPKEVIKTEKCMITLAIEGSNKTNTVEQAIVEMEQ